MMLNLGSGPDIKPHPWINVDYYYSHQNVIKMNFLETPWNFPNEIFSKVYVSHVLEHIPVLFKNEKDIFFIIMEEIHRVLKPGGILHIRVPYPKDIDGQWSNPMHYRAITINWFHYFNNHARENYYTTAKFQILSYRNKKLGPKFGDKLKINNLGLNSHLWVRFPLLRFLLPSIRETEIFLEKQ